MKTLQTYTFKEPVAKAKHDWKPLSDGKIYELEAGKDFTSKPNSVAQQLRAFGKKNGLTCRVSIDKDSGNVVVQFKKAEVNGQPEQAPQRSKKGKK